MAKDNYVEVTDQIMEVTEPPKKKKRGKTKYDEERNDKIVKAVDAEMGDSYNYSSAELYTQMAKAWERYYCQPYGNEVKGYSQWVSPMIQKHVNQARAFITGQYFRNSSPIIKFRPKGAEDIDSADLATEYVNYIFRNKLDGHKIVDDLVFNAALLKIAAVRVTMKEKHNRDEVEFKFPSGTDAEFVDALAMFFAANPDYMDVEPDYKKEDLDNPDNVYACYRWTTPEVVERYPEIDVISPGAFFVSRQAEDEDEARMVAQMSRMTISELKEQFPDAPKLNGYGKRSYDKFWEELVSDYQEWYTEIEWLAKWSHDSLGFVSQYTEGNDQSAGLGAKQIFVMDAEIKVDLDDTGYTQLMHVIKVGRHILHKKDITERTFIWGSLLPTANRWLGLGFWDLLEQHAKEETLNMRAFTDATVQAAHANPIVDPDQIETDDVENRKPDSMIRRKRGAAAKAGVPGIEWTKQPGPDPSILGVVESFQTTATSLTGVGTNFQGATVDDTADMRVSTETAKIIDNNSSLMLNYFARNFANLLCRILVKVLNVAVNGSATPQLLEIKNNWENADPVMMQARSDFILKADIGVNDEQDKFAKAQAIQGLIAATQGGGTGPDGQPIPALPIQLTPTAGYEAAKIFLEAQGIVNPDMWVVNPQIAQEQVQTQAAQEMIAQITTQTVEQMVPQIMEQAMQSVDARVAEADIAKKTAEAESIKTKTDREAFDVANKDLAEDRRTEEAAMKEATDQRKLDLQERELEAKIRQTDRELDIQEKLAEQAKETKTSNVVSPKS